MWSCSLNLGFMNKSPLFQLFSVSWGLQKCYRAFKLNVTLSWVHRHSLTRSWGSLFLAKATHGRQPGSFLITETGATH